MAEEIGNNSSLLSHLPSGSPDCTQHKESDCFLQTATTDRSSTEGKVLYCHSIDASDMRHLVGNVTSFALPDLKSQRREKNCIIQDACNLGQKPSLTPVHIRLQTCQCHCDVTRLVWPIGHMSQST